jgi:predicted nucleotidyltransferase
MRLQDDAGGSAAISGISGAPGQTTGGEHMGSPYVLIKGHSSRTRPGSQIGWDLGDKPRPCACYNAAMRPSDALAAHRTELRQLVRRHGLARPRVFGSVLSGTDTEQSDLDLLVDPAVSTSLLTLAAFKIDAEELLGVPVTVLTPNALPPKFRSELLQRARPL